MINVQTKEYYGPFDLLLELIEKSKMDIYDIQISEITNAYMEQINSMYIPAEEITDFILIAATLLQIKTRTLVKDKIEIEEDDDEEISKEELVRRLVEYKKIKKIAILLRKFEKRGLSKHTKLQEDLQKYQEDLIDDIIFDKMILKASIEALILKSSLDSEFKVEKILNIEEYSLEEYNKKIQDEVLLKRLVSISKMLKKVEKKSEAIIIFLSILELSKINKIIIKQDKDTKEIIILSNEVNNER